MKFGFHVSSSLWSKPSEKKKHGLKLKGRLDECFSIAKWAECETFQVFTKSPRQWAYKPLDPAVLENFVSESKDNAEIEPIFSHLFYLPNFATPDDLLFQRSIKSLSSEVERCTLLGIPYVVIHLGHHRGAGKEFGIQRCCNALDHILELDFPVKILLENTSGSKESIGGVFEDLVRVREGVSDSTQIEVCFDTCHAFAAGYGLRNKKEVNKTLSNLDKVVGLQHVHLIHCNDSMFPLGSHRDRHEAIGQGEIGKSGFSAFFQDERIQGKPCILETPAKTIDDDMQNLAILKAYRKGNNGS